MGIVQYSCRISSEGISNFGNPKLEGIKKKHLRKEQFGFSGFMCNTNCTDHYLYGYIT